jgi:hypothetical protein
MTALDQVVVVFMCYRTADGRDYVERFDRELRAHSPRIRPWYDRHIPRDRPIDESIEEALAGADVVLLVLTAGIGEWSRDELEHALKSKIRIVVARMHRDARAPMRVGRLPVFDFAADYDAARAELLEYLDGVARSPRPGADVDPAARPQRHRREPPVRDGSGAGIREPNKMPDVADVVFQDRVDQVDAIERALRDPDPAVTVVTGPSGTGKTALIGELRRRLNTSELRGLCSGFVYLSGTGYRQVTATVLLEDVTKALADAAEGGRLRSRMRQLTWSARLDAVVGALDPGAGVVVVAIDDAETLLDGTSVRYDRELHTLLREFERRRTTVVRLVLTMGRPPRALLRGIRHTVVCDLGDGLPAPVTRPFLHELDPDDVLRFSDLPDDEVGRLNGVSGGNPRALELIYCLLHSDRTLQMRAVLDDLERAVAGTGPAGTIELLLRRIMPRLDPTARRVVQGLAVYARPVLPEAVDDLLTVYVTDIDSASVLEELHALRLVRRDGDRYYLPPGPDAEYVRHGIPPGERDDREHGWTGPDAPYDVPTLRLRAADHYKELGRQPREITQLDDLRPEFGEIEMRVEAGAYTWALEVMARIDDAYLRDWGQSQALIGWRRRLLDKIPDKRLAAHNRSYLVAATEGEEDPTGSAVRTLTADLRRSWVLFAPRDALRLRLQVAGTHFDDGRIALAARQFRWAVPRLLWRLRPMRAEAAIARTNRGLCLARLGRFKPALREFAAASRLAGRAAPERRAKLRAELLLNEGWTRGQIGDARSTDRALALLREGAGLARKAGDLLLYGTLLDTQAAILCDLGEPATAIELAIDAADHAVRSRDTSLSRNANVTLALAYLCDNELAKAAAAVDAAVRLPSGPAALGAQALQGVVLYRLDDLTGARLAFHAACTEGWLRLRREPRDYLAYDVCGLALCGLELCGEDNRLAHAVDCYRAGRRIAAADGVRRRAVLQLGFFGDRADPRIVGRAKRAANGDPVADDSILAQSGIDVTSP